LKVTKEELVLRQNMSLQDKIDFTCNRIEQWYDYWKGDIYIAFSGGKDSRVLLDLVRNKAFIPDAKLIPAVYNDTGLEYPEIKEFVKTFDNVVITRPKLTYREVIEKYGYAVVSKEQSRFLFDMWHSKSDKLKGIRMNGNKWGMGKISEKWKYLLSAPFKISDRCCEVLKKNPSKVYERKTGRKGMIGSTVEESFMRKETYMRFGCNAYETKRPLSMPLAIWTEQDILAYIVRENLNMASVYGEIKQDESGKYYLTGVQRTGCIWCMYGLDRDKGEKNRLQKLKETHPKIWNYCINNLGLGDVLDFMEIAYE
jgi:3'-phosphoadenosine 5'-phosphosulfate sulfotransferase (PAPS reductase)/FAD synthetase